MAPPVMNSWFVLGDIDYAITSFQFQDDSCEYEFRMVGVSRRWSRHLFDFVADAKQTDEH